MFFAVDLLCPQHGGKFAIAWLCATRGVHYRRKQILECDLVKLCNDILEMMISDSNRPKLRLSLSLSARLIYGAVKIYREQVKALEGLVMQLFVYKLQFTSELDNSAPVLKKRRKRKIVPVEASMIMPPPQFVNEDLQSIIHEIEVRDAIGPVVNEDYVTMREEAPQFNPQMVCNVDKTSFTVRWFCPSGTHFNKNCICTVGYLHLGVVFEGLIHVFQESSMFNKPHLNRHMTSLHIKKVYYVDIY